jgi:hypothetical protein
MLVDLEKMVGQKKNVVYQKKDARPEKCRQYEKLAGQES